MVKVFFRPSSGDDRLITVCDETLVLQYIHAFINACNEKNKAKGCKEFKSYYTRSWTDDDGKTWYDVGSHSEFFYTIAAKGGK